MVSLLSWENCLWSSVGRQKQEVERLNLARSSGGDAKSCLADTCYTLLCLVGKSNARQIFQRLQVVSGGGTWRHGVEVYRRRPLRAKKSVRREVVTLGAVVVSTVVRPGKDYASV